MDMEKLIRTIMITEGINLLQAQRVVSDMVSEAVDKIREDYLAANNTTVEEMAGLK